MNVEILFGAAIAIIPIALTVLSSSWKTLSEMIASLPEGKRKVTFNLRDTTDRQHKNKAELVTYQCFGCISLVLSVVLALFSIFLTASTFVGYNLGFHLYQQQDYNAGKTCLYISIFLLCLGFFFIGLNYGLRLLALLRGSLDPLSTKTSDLPVISEHKVAEIELFEKRYFYAFLSFLVIFGILISWNYFAQWFDCIIAFLVSGIYFFFAWLRKHRKSKPTTNMNQPILLPPVIDQKEEIIK